MGLERAQDMPHCAGDCAGFRGRQIPKRKVPINSNHKGPHYMTFQARQVGLSVFTQRP